MNAYAPQASADAPVRIPWQWVPERDRLGFVTCPRTLLREAAFLDFRLDIRGRPQEEGPFPATAPRTPVAWIAHSSLCGSTFLSRILSAPGHTCVLREPWTLRQIADWSRGLLAGPNGVTPDEAVRRTDVLVHLLNAASGPGERLIIKPTNLVNTLLIARIANGAREPVLVLTGTLTEFLTAVLRRPKSLVKMPALARNLACLRREQFPSSLSERVYDTFFRPTDNDCLLAAAGVWLLHQCEFETLRQRGATGQVALLTSARLFEAPLATCAASARHLGASLPEAVLARRIAEHRERHAKAPAIVPFSAAERRREDRALLHRHVNEVNRVRSQAERWLRECASPILPPDVVSRSRTDAAHLL